MEVGGEPKVGLCTHSDSKSTPVLSVWDVIQSTREAKTAVKSSLVPN